MRSTWPYLVPLLLAGCRLELPADGDASAPDAAPSDAAPPDAAPSDAAPPDAAPPDAAPPDAAPPDAAPPDGAVDHSDQLPPGVSPPILWFWRGIHQGNLGNWRTDELGRSCADGDTTMWFRSPGNQAEWCGGAPACDPDHFGTPEAPCTGEDCCWRNWDDPRGPGYRVREATGPVFIENWGAQGLGGDAPGFGFGVTMCAAPGTVAVIDTCPRGDVYSCVQDRYPQFVDDCTTVLLTVDDPPPQFEPSQAGCYSLINDVTITF